MNGNVLSSSSNTQPSTLILPPPFLPPSFLPITANTINTTNTTGVILSQSTISELTNNGINNNNNDDNKSVSIFSIPSVLDHELPSLSHQSAAAYHNINTVMATNTATGSSRTTITSATASINYDESLSHQSAAVYPDINTVMATNTAAATGSASTNTTTTNTTNTSIATIATASSNHVHNGDDFIHKDKIIINNNNNLISHPHAIDLSIPTAITISSNNSKRTLEESHDLNSNSNSSDNKTDQAYKQSRII